MRIFQVAASMHRIGMVSARRLGFTIMSHQQLEVLVKLLFVCLCTVVTCLSELACSGKQKSAEMSRPLVAKSIAEAAQILAWEFARVLKIL